MNANPLPTQELVFPGGPLPLRSPLYIERPPIEDAASQELLKCGSILRIQAPRQMGKSSLLMNLMAFAKDQNYRRVKIDFQEADIAVFSGIDPFLRWFCANVGRQLKLENRLDQYWDQDIGSKVSCTYYFEDYLLETVNCPVFLALNEVDRIFEYPDIAQDFLPLLRYWHEQAKHVEIFRNLRLAIIHSTELYIPIQIHQSPFNVGLPIRLTDFNLAQSQELAVRYELDWAKGNCGTEILQPLLDIIGGNPYRLALAFYSLKTDQVLTLDHLLQSVFTAEGIYGNHLQMIAMRLHKDPPLKAAYKEVVSTADWVEIDLTQAYKLISLGIATMKGNAVRPSCELYRCYFRTHLSGMRTSESRIRALESENRRLKGLAPENITVANPAREVLDAQRQSQHDLDRLQEDRDNLEPVFPQVEVASDGSATNSLLLGGRYRIQSELSSGGFGQTYIAEDTQRPGQPNCIVKKLASWFGIAELAIARRLFATEAQTLEQLGTHDQIPRLLAYFEQDAEFYLVQEFIEGSSLNEELSNCVMGWDEAQIMKFLNEILPVLAFVHNHQVIHRDLKPDNILRRQSDGKLVLIDFGVSKSLCSNADEAEQQRTVAVGTCGYTAWEQVQGIPQINSDLYAVGMIAIEAATGKHPDRIERNSKMGLEWRTGQPNFNPWLAAILDGMVRVNPFERYQTAEEILQDLSMIARHE